jgi:hypothetical protein
MDGRPFAGTIRLARAKDAPSIIQLYHEIYDGTYPDPMMSEYARLEHALASEEYRWLVAEEGDRLVGSVVYRVDRGNRLAKVFGALVEPAQRGHRLTEQMMEEGRLVLKRSDAPIEVIYATTRTVAAAPQKLTASLGYRRLGVFPNVHKTEKYETHCLTALFEPGALEKRFTAFRLHPKIATLYEIVRGECDLPALPIAASAPEIPGPRKPVQRLELETIDAPNFVRHRFLDERPTVQEHTWFFPFHEPNVVLTTPDQAVEIFAYYSETDKHCVLMGIRDVHEIGYATIFANCCRELRNLGARYIEFIIRADEIQKVEVSLRARFVPSAYFPALQLSAAGHRFDYVVFSRSFEILDFQDLELEGVNRQYLREYFKTWKEISLDRSLLDA